MIEPVERAWVPLTADERRVLGVLVEKAKTTPDVYPLSLAALVTGCNQKSNRDPVVTYDADDVEETCQRLRKKGAVIQVDAGGRVVRYKHLMYEWLKVNKVESAVMTELLLRGTQTEGDLRARASRMEPIADLAALATVLDALKARDLVVFLSPPGVRRGIVVTHNLYAPKDLDRERARYSQGSFDAPEPETGHGPAPSRPGPTRPSGPQVDPAEIQMLRAEIQALRADVEPIQALVKALAHEVRELKAALGAE